MYILSFNITSIWQSTISNDKIDIDIGTNDVGDSDFNMSFANTSNITINLQKLLEIINCVTGKQLILSVYYAVLFLSFSVILDFKI